MGVVTILAGDVEGDITQTEIDGVIARTALFAPCILSEALPEPLERAARDIIVQALKRRAQGGSGAIVTEGTPHFNRTIDNRQTFKDLFYASERDELLVICRTASGIESSGGVLPAGEFPAPEVYPDAVSVPVW